MKLIAADGFYILHVPKLATYGHSEISSSILTLCEVGAVSTRMGTLSHCGVDSNRSCSTSFSALCR